MLECQIFLVVSGRTQVCLAGGQDWGQKSEIENWFDLPKLGRSHHKKLPVNYFAASRWVHHLQVEDVPCSAGYEWQWLRWARERKDKKNTNTTQHLSIRTKRRRYRAIISSFWASTRPGWCTNFVLPEVLHTQTFPTRRRKRVSMYVALSRGYVYKEVARSNSLWRVEWYWRIYEKNKR